ncbi:Proline rich antigen 2 [Phytophthora cinnamomi]|uniref:Proline rich antigen 2 n=1 Tax=Phytophthora cinnamomi TaxID=4785 RepID=UPI00355A7155|nr:Proline rich antigen 2 [Phytophthora cinnamomi]
MELSPPKRSRANTDGDAGSNGVRPKGVTLQEPPLITSFAHEDLVKWKRKRVLYENAVENRCAETEEAIAAVRRSVQKSTNNMLLKSFSEYELRIPVENVTEETLLAAIGHITGSEMSAAMPDVTRVVNEAPAIHERCLHTFEYTRFGNPRMPAVAVVYSYLDWHVAKHDVYGEQFCTSWEAADEDHEDMDDFNLDELHDALDDAALIDE